jgi:transcriptional regulator with XRE-family HTH domain
MERGGWNQSSLARESGVSRETIWRILNSKAESDRETFEALAEAMLYPLPAVILTDSGAAIVPSEVARSLSQTFLESGEDEGPGWLEGDESEAEDAFRSFIRGIERTIRGMVDGGSPTTVTLRQLRLHAIAATRESCAAAGRAVPDFVQKVENEVIEGSFD